MMTHGLLNSGQDVTLGSFRIATPYAADVVAGALHSAYDDGLDLPDEFQCLLDSLDEID